MLGFRLSTQRVGNCNIDAQTNQISQERCFLMIGKFYGKLIKVRMSNKDC